MSPTNCCTGGADEGVALLEIYQGDDYSSEVYVYEPGTNPPEPVDLTGYTARAQLRRNVADQDPIVAAEVTCVITLPNKITLSILHDVTTTLTGLYVWDLELVSEFNAVETILTGNAPVTPEVTRAAAIMVASAYVK